MLRKLTGLLVVMMAMAFAAPAMAAKAGDTGKAEWKGQMYDVVVKQVKGDQCFIHWTGYGKGWDEWKACIEITSSGAAPADNAGAASYTVGNPVQVSWKGSWYPAHVIAVNKGSYKIHYDGYDASWDEWITTARMKK